MMALPTAFFQRKKERWTVALDGKVGEYVTIARKKNDVWYVGAMSNWDERDITINFSFLGEGNFEAIVFKDGITADRDATDYKKNPSG